MPKVDPKELAAKEKITETKTELDAAIDTKDIENIETAQQAAKEALQVMEELRKGKPAEQDEKDLVDCVAKADAEVAAIKEEMKKVKEAARKRVMQAIMKAAPFTGDKAELQEAVDEGEKAGVPDKELLEAKEKLTAMISFQVMLGTAATELKASAVGDALNIDDPALEEKINEVKEGAMSSLKKVVCELYLGLLTKPAPTAVATDTLDTTIAEAIALGVDETIVKAMKKKNEESKKAQNAKKIADRKAKKPPTDPPAPPDAPEAHPDVQKLKDDLEGAMTEAEGKLLEARTSKKMVEVSDAKLLTAEKLNDLDERPVADEHPVIAELDGAVKAAEAAKAQAGLVANGKEALETAKKTRFAARTGLAKARLLEASADPPEKCDVKKLGAAIGVAKAESVEEAVVDTAIAHEANSYKRQSENVLEPLAQPEELSHEGFQIIDPLTAALAEARKRNAVEDLLIKGQAKLDFWIEARARRDKGKKELDASLAPPPCTVDQAKVRACLDESEASKLDPALLLAAAKKLEVARLAQRVYERAKAEPGTLDIPTLEGELKDVGSGALKVEQEKQKACEDKVEEFKTKIEAIKETRDAQKQRDAQLAKQVKKGAKKDGKGKKEDELVPAWVRAAAEEEAAAASGLVPKEVALSVGSTQDEELAELTEKLKAAEAALKAQEEVVKNFGSEVVVPTDVVEFAQLKLKASKTCDAMQKLQLPELLDLQVSKLTEAIKASEFKFGELPIAGLDDLDCNVPKSEIEKAKNRLRDASKAQARQSRARSQLQVRVSAPTGTATFDLLVKLVAEGKAAGVEEPLIAKAELKLKKMEELAAASLRAGPLAFVSFHFPCLRTCVSQYAISLVEKAEEKRREDAERASAAEKALMEIIGTWEKGQATRELLKTDENALKEAIHMCAEESLPQEVIELGRAKLFAISKYKSDLEKGLIKDEEAEAKKKAEAAKSGGKSAKPKFKNYGYVKKADP